MSWASSGGPWLRAKSVSLYLRFIRQLGAHSNGIVRIDGASFFVNGLNDTLLIDNEGRALRPLIVFLFSVIGLENTVLRQHFAIHVAKQRKGHANFLRKRVVGRG